MSDKNSNEINKLLDIVDSSPHCPFNYRCETDSGLCGLIGVCKWTRGKAISPKEFEKLKTKGD